MCHAARAALRASRMSRSQGHEVLAKAAAAFQAENEQRITRLLTSGHVSEVECDGNE